MKKSWFYTWGTALLGIAFVIGGLSMLFLGYQTNSELVQDLRSQNLEVQNPAILLTYEHARAPEGVDVPKVLIDTAQEANDQAEVIMHHTLAATEGKTYSQLDREDPNRQLWVTSLTLQNSLHMAQMGLQVTLLVMGIGVAFTGLGLAVLIIFLPIVRKVVG